jgi:PAS domain S-box-containing protein
VAEDFHKPGPARLRPGSNGHTSRVQRWTHHGGRTTSVHLTGSLQYGTLVETAGDPMFVLDTDGYLELLNEALVECTAASHEDEIRGRHSSDITAEKGFRKGRDVLRRLLSGDGSDRWTSFEIRDRGPPGEERYSGSGGALRFETDDWTRAETRLPPEDM